MIITINDRKSDPIAVWLQKGRQPVRSFTAAVHTVMDFKADTARNFLKSLFDEKVNIGDEPYTVCQLAAARLVQIEMKFRAENDFAMTLLPFNLNDFNESMEYAREKAKTYVRASLDENGEPKKRGRKGDGLNQVKGLIDDNPELLEMKGKDAAKKVEEELGIAYNTALNYFYKAKKDLEDEKDTK